MNYGGGIYSIIVDENYTNFIKDEELIVNSNQLALIDNKEWSILKNDIDNRNNNVLKNDDNNKNSSKKSKRNTKR